MSQKLQQAIVATRAGQTKEAQFLLTETLEENPEEVQAWYLLSMLVDSPSKQIAYLQKTVALDPSHVKAQSRLQQLLETETAAATPATGMEEAPTPIDDELDILDEVASPSAPAPIVDSLLTEDDEDDLEPATIPDWLRDPFDEMDVVDEQATVVSERTQTLVTPPESVDVVDDEPAVKAAAAVAPPAPINETAVSQSKKATAPKTDVRRMNAILTLLLFGAVLTAVLLVFVLLTG